MKAFIFAAGLGTRLHPLTLSKPKALVEADGRTLIERCICCLKAAGINDFVINVHHFAEQIEDYLAKHNNFDCNILISDERKQLLDTGGAVAAARDLLGNEPFLIHNVDIVSNLNITSFLSKGLQGAAARLVVSQRQTSRYLLIDKDSKLCGWTNVKTGEIRGPALNMHPSDYYKAAFSGIHIFGPQLFPNMDKWPSCFSIIDFYLSVCDIFPIEAEFCPELIIKDLGTPQAIASFSDFQ